MLVYLKLVLEVMPLQVKRIAEAGSLESGDLLVVVAPSDDISVEITSSVEKQFGEHIRQIVIDLIHSMSVGGVYVKIQDRGALDYVILARMSTALRRSFKDEAP